MLLETLGFKVDLEIVVLKEVFELGFGRNLPKSLPRFDLVV